MCLVHRKFLAAVFRASNSHIFTRPCCLNSIGFSCTWLANASTTLWPNSSVRMTPWYPWPDWRPQRRSPLSCGVLQEQFKFVYDTLEEYVVCGTSFFYVQELSERLKAKSLKDKQTKKHPNEYEKEYSVSHPLCMLTTTNMGNEGSPCPTEFSLHLFLI